MSKQNGKINMTILWPRSYYHTIIVIVVHCLAFGPTLTVAPPQKVVKQTPRLIAISPTAKTVDGEWMLEYVQVLLRHGKRAPVDPPFDKDPLFNERNFPRKRGNLTTDGIHEARETGVDLYKRYLDGKFLSNNEEELIKQLFATSTTSPRAQESVNAALQGFLQLPNVNNELDQLPKSPVPFAPSKYADYGLYFWSVMRKEDFICPRFNAFANEALRQFAHRLETVYASVVVHARRVANATTIHKLRLLEGLIHEHEAKLKLPDWAMKPFPEHGKKFFELAGVLCLDFQKALAVGVQGELRNGRLIHEWLKKPKAILDAAKAAQQRPAGKRTTPPLDIRFGLYGAHCETQVGLLGTMGVREQLPFPTSGLIVLEVWRKMEERKVKMLQYGHGEFKPLAFCQNGKTTECPLQTFYTEFEPKAIANMVEMKDRCEIKDTDDFQQNFKLNPHVQQRYNLRSAP